MAPFLNISLAADLSSCTLGLVFVSGGFLALTDLLSDDEGLAIVFEVCDFSGNFSLAFSTGLTFFVAETTILFILYD